MRSAMSAASQLPGRGPIDADVVPAPACYMNYHSYLETLFCVNCLVIH